MSFGAGIRGDRGRTRGGKDQFNWEDVKGDANRMRYLGNSLHAAVGRWQDGKDLTWWSNNDGEGSSGAGGGDGEKQEKRRREMAEIRYSEEVARCSALGLPVPPRPSNLMPVVAATSELTQKEREKLLGRRTNKISEEEDADRITDASARLAASNNLSLDVEKREKKKKKKKKSKSKKRKRKKERDTTGAASESSEGEDEKDSSKGEDGKDDKKHKMTKKDRKKSRTDMNGSSCAVMHDEEEMLRQAMQYLEKQKSDKR